MDFTYTAGHYENCKIVWNMEELYRTRNKSFILSELSVCFSQFLFYICYWFTNSLTPRHVSDIAIDCF